MYQPPTAANPPTWSRFVPIRFHARGGLGEVLVAQDTELNRAVALKRMLGEVAGDPETRRRFVLEAEITGRLEHPGVVPVYGLGLDPQTRQPCYAMRFITGRSLKSAIDEFHSTAGDFHSLGFRKLLGCFVSVCQTISFAHSKGVLHRDLKPANVMVGRHGETLVVDWGLAKVLDEPATPAAGRARPRVRFGSGSATREGAGTPGYMAPEQAAGEVEQLGPAADVYGLGATLYHLLTGDGPLSDQSTVAAVSLTMMGQVPSARSVNAGVPAALDAVCRKAMAHDPRSRYASAEALAADCERWLADEPVSCLRERPTARAKRWMRRHPTTVATSLAAVILLGAGALTVTGLVNAQRAALAEKNDQLADKNAEIAAERDRANQERDRANAERDRAVTAEAAAAEERDRAVAAEKQARTAEKQAADNFAEARQVLRSCLDLARSHPVFQQQGLQEARELLLRAAAPFHDRFAAVGGTRELKVEAVIAKFQAAVQSAQTRSQAEALTLIRQCVAELKTLVAENPSVPDFRGMLASCHGNLGIQLMQAGKIAESDAEFREGLRLLSELHQQFPNITKYRADLANVHHNFGVLKDYSNDWSGSEREYREAIRLRRELVRAFAGRLDYRSELAGTHNNLGVVLMLQRKPTEAEAEYRESHRLHTELVAANPAMLDYQSGLAHCYVNIGQSLAVRRDFAGALREYRTAVQMYETLTTRNPAIVQLTSDGAAAHNNLALLLRELGQKSEALTEIRTAMTLFEQCVTKVPSSTTYARQLSKSRMILAAMTADSDPAEAVRLLRLSGPAARTLVLQDKAFDPLRSRADYQELLREWSRPVPPGTGPKPPGSKSSSRP